MPSALSTLLDRAIHAREALLDASHEGALRLFNGFTEGQRDLAIDVYGRTAVVHDYAEHPTPDDPRMAETSRVLQARLPWLRAIVRKQRSSTDEGARNGTLLIGTHLDKRVREGGVSYALDLRLNRDASLYLDTRNVRAWAVAHLRDKAVLNTFAHTCSLGVAATAGGATRVLNADLNKRFLTLGKDSYALNGFTVRRGDFQVGDFWRHTSGLIRAGERFDCVFVDPPFFSATSDGVVDLGQSAARLINKVRPLVSDGGCIVAVNNALFTTGAEYLADLRALCADGYVAIEQLLPVPEDFVGFPATRASDPIVDPAPFNHSTKIVVLRVRHKTRAAK